MVLSWLNKGNKFFTVILWGVSPTIAAIITARILYGMSNIKELFSGFVKKFELKWLVILIVLQLIIYAVGFFNILPVYKSTR
jgi:hypothetical protein